MALRVTLLQDFKKKEKSKKMKNRRIETERDEE